jgi:hypothetical protein
VVVVVVVDCVVVGVGCVQPAKATIPRVQIPRATSFEYFMKQKIKNKTYINQNIPTALIYQYPRKVKAQTRLCAPESAL